MRVRKVVPRNMKKSDTKLSNRILYLREMSAKHAWRIKRSSNKETELEARKQLEIVNKELSKVVREAATEDFKKDIQKQVDG